MKNALAAAALFLLVACGSPAKVTPMPDVNPAVTSNDAARKSIHSTKKHVEDTGKDIESGNDKLGNVDKLLDRLLNE